MLAKWFRSLARLENALRLAAAVILVAGLVSSVLIWRAQDRLEREKVASQPGDPEVVLSPLEDRKQLGQLEYYGGDGVVLMEEAKALFHGKPLAKTIAVISTVSAAALFMVTVRRPD